MCKIDPTVWEPEDIVLEDRALQVVKSDDNLLVSAGPGAGKTELLAQKASYLLQTNTCSNPRRILAISFKKDAKSNLEERVAKRCGKKLSDRFDSMTFDGFAKQLVDQFRTAIPEKYRPSIDYNIASDDLLRDVYLKHHPELKGTTASRINSMIHNNLRNGEKFPNLNESLHKVWLDLLDKSNTGKSEITFSMISILAKYLIDKNPLIRKGLRATYSHLFLDEFQDTTSIQYELMKSCFGDSDIGVTAVGDSKQRIMVWAGAKTDIFTVFKNEFKAQEAELLMNYRSSPKLIKLQMLLYPLLKEDIEEINPSDKWKAEEGEAVIHYFNNCEQEATRIAGEIKELISEGVDHREIVILIKHSLPIYTNKIQEALLELGIRSRDEGVFQDLLDEEIVKFILSSFCVSRMRDADKWMFLVDFLSSIYEVNDEEVAIEDIYILIDEVVLICQQKSEKLTLENTSDDLLILIKELVDKVGYDKIAAIHNQYIQEDYFNDILTETADLLWEEFRRHGNWTEALAGFEGEATIPMMTIHKSKGLEYEAVFFVGLEDQAFFSYDRQPYEENSAFFVAVSRAKKRIDFTFSSYRELAKYRKDQTYNTIDILHKTLKESGIVTVLDHSVDTESE